jgi:hypothetical protein
MFVLSKTHAELQATHLALRHAYKKLLDEWNEVATKINDRGGMAYLDGRTQGPAQLDEEDIKRLLMLCHPDKHGGKPMAEEMTKKLLALRASSK